jgi:hypothetical protein
LWWARWASNISCSSFTIQSTAALIIDIIIYLAMLKSVISA